MQPQKNTRDRLYYNSGKHLSPWRETLNTIIFGAETNTGKLFDIILIRNVHEIT